MTAPNVDSNDKSIKSAELEEKRKNFATALFDKIDRNKDGFIFSLNSKPDEASFSVASELYSYMNKLIYSYNKGTELSAKEFPGFVKKNGLEFIGDFASIATTKQKITGNKYGYYRNINSADLCRRLSFLLDGNYFDEQEKSTAIVKKGASGFEYLNKGLSREEFLANWNVTDLKKTINSYQSRIAIYEKISCCPAEVVSLFKKISERLQVLYENDPSMSYAKAKEDSQIAGFLKDLNKLAEQLEKQGSEVQKNN